MKKKKSACLSHTVLILLLTTKSGWHVRVSAPKPIYAYIHSHNIAFIMKCVFCLREESNKQTNESALRVSDIFFFTCRRHRINYYLDANTLECIVRRIIICIEHRHNESVIIFKQFISHFIGMQCWMNAFGKWELETHTKKDGDGERERDEGKENGNSCRSIRAAAAAATKHHK